MALLDYDGDGWLDVYAVQGGPLPPPREPHLRRPTLQEPWQRDLRRRERRAGLRDWQEATGMESPSATTTTTVILTCS